MKKHLMLFVLISLIGGVTAAHAQWAVPRYTISSAGFVSAGGSFRLLATVGQPVVGAVGLTRAGFWPTAFSMPTDVEAIDSDGLPAAFQRYGNYPNPFNRSTTIRFDLPEPGEVRVEVLDVLGRKVWTGAPRRFDAGPGQVYTVDASRLASGVYVYRIVVETGSGVTTRAGRMMRIR